jgi:hypothetical protein
VLGATHSTHPHQVTFDNVVDYLVALLVKRATQQQQFADNFAVEILFIELLVGR